MTLTPRRAARLAGISLLAFYCGLLLTAALPTALWPARPLLQLKLGSSFLLHLVGITPGLEVFDGDKALHALHRMSCFRVVGQGERSVVLYDDLALCRKRTIEPIRDPFRVFQMRNLSAAFVHLNLGGHRNLTGAPLRPLFLLSDYYCHVPAARQAGVRRVAIETLYVGLNLEDGSTGEVPMRGYRDCRKPTWIVEADPQP
jgi:hypothetical protein